MNFQQGRLEYWRDNNPKKKTLNEIFLKPYDDNHNENSVQYVPCIYLV